MSIKIENYDFEGPFDDTSDLRNESGVYAILGRNSVNEDWDVVDIGESGDVKKRVENHDRKNCWEAQNYTILNYAAYYCTAIERHFIEQELRDIYTPPCGDR